MPFINVDMHTIPENLPVYSIGSAARILGVSVQTLRLYESEGLILPQKSAGGHRLYSELDIERLKCIRKAIVEDKIGINGIRRMQSLIPCWQFAGCSESDRKSCPAYGEHAGGCWTYKHQNNACAERTCPSCQVYIKSSTCAGIKEMIQESTRHIPPTSFKEQL